jgi:predicted transglutaminase-like cysteine proteinase
MRLLRHCVRTRWDACRGLSLIALAGASLLGDCFSGLSAARAKAITRVATAPPARVAGAQANPTPAWLAFCRRRPGECAVKLSEPAVIQLTAAAWQTIVSVNQRVNSTIRLVTDSQHWGVEDRWDYPDDGYGDCEDLQLLKRRLLVQAGFPRRALRMAAVIDDEGGHAVLMVRTDQGDLVLDNKTHAVLPWSQTGYTYVKREGTNGAAWVSLK